MVGQGRRFTWGELEARRFPARSIIEEDVVNGLTPAPPTNGRGMRVSCASEGDMRLIYLGEHQPALWIAGLPTDDRALRS